MSGHERCPHQGQNRACVRARARVCVCVCVCLYVVGWCYYCFAVVVPIHCGWLVPSWCCLLALLLEGLSCVSFSVSLSLSFFLSPSLLILIHFVDPFSTRLGVSAIFSRTRCISVSLLVCMCVKSWHRAGSFVVRVARFVSRLTRLCTHTGVSVLLNYCTNDLTMTRVVIYPLTIDIEYPIGRWRASGFAVSLSLFRASQLQLSRMPLLV